MKVTHTKNIPERFKDHPIFNELVCGSNFGFLSKRGYYFTDFAKKQPELMKNIGINWTTLNMNLCQETVLSRKHFLDFEFSSAESEIIEMTKRLHDNGIKVILKPCMTCLDGGAMCQICFPPKEYMKHIEGVETDYWGEWFKSYTEAQKYFADLAERAGIECLMTGAELLWAEAHDEHWKNVIDAVRDNFSGPITYEFTPESRKKAPLGWMEHLDFLSYSYYPPAADPNVEPMLAYSNPGAKDVPNYTVDEMTAYLSSRRDKIASIMETYGNKPILFTEIGTRSAHGCVMQPFNYQWDTPYDGEEQANYMEAVFRTFTELDGWMGLLWWKWDETQKRPHYLSDPRGDRGFTIQGKPAEDVMRRWFTKA